MVVSTTDVGTFNRWVTRAALNPRALKNRKLVGPTLSGMQARPLFNIPTLVVAFDVP